MAKTNSKKQPASKVKNPKIKAPAKKTAAPKGKVAVVKEKPKASKPKVLAKPAKKVKAASSVKAPVKTTAKPIVKKVAVPPSKKTAAPAQVKSGKVSLNPKKNDPVSKKSDESDKLKSTQLVKDKSSNKKDSAKKKGKSEDMEDADDFIDDGDGAGSEIEEYADVLEEVEAIDDVVDEDEETLVAETENRESEDVALTDAEGRRFCRYKDCDQIGLVEGYCRLHYLLLWKKIQNRKKILQDGKLQRYVEELTARYPDKFLEIIKKDLRSEKDFLGAIQELEIDDSGTDSGFEEEAESFIDEVRGIGDTPSMDDDEF